MGRGFESLRWLQVLYPEWVLVFSPEIYPLPISPAVSVFPFCYLKSSANTRQEAVRSPESVLLFI
jgi:hypothetical protein